MHGQGLDLSFQDAHAACGDHGPDIWHHTVTEDLVDEAVVAQVAGMGHMLHGETVIWICGTIHLSCSQVNSLVASPTLSVAKLKYFVASSATMLQS